MPRISEFFGIVIWMYFNEHEPPHFHAKYSGNEYVVAISPISFLHGRPSPRIRSMLLEWTGIHQTELLANWDRMREELDPIPVAPLE